MQHLLAGRLAWQGHVVVIHGDGAVEGNDGAGDVDSLGQGDAGSGKDVGIDDSLSADGGRASDLGGSRCTTSSSESGSGWAEGGQQACGAMVGCYMTDEPGGVLTIQSTDGG